MMGQIDEWFFLERLKQAYEVRRIMRLTNQPHTNCFRLVHSEGDGLAGLIVDIYGHTAVVQAQTEGMALHLKEIVRALKLLSCRPSTTRAPMPCNAWARRTSS